MKKNEDGMFSCPHPAIKKRLDYIWEKNNELALANSRNSSKTADGNGGYIKYCTLCGRRFNTVNETRQTCEKCQGDIFRKDDIERAHREEKRRESRRNYEENRKRRKAEKKQREKASKK